ncbi:unnamed protein product [Calicophoron daubneyi]|uniref:Rab3 GTPase-activating protein non-catalytic subunit n=1 Tax=Calicophoron daubneyi TaxID=300641 RepID=A0AAV2TZL8_CALDB
MLWASRDETLYRELDLSSPILSLLCTSLSHRASKSLGTDVDVVVAGTLDGRLVFIQTNGGILLELSLESGAIRSTLIRLDNEPQDFLVLCDSCAFSLNLDDLRNIILVSAGSACIVDFQQANKKNLYTYDLRCRLFYLPTGGPHYQFSCSASRVPLLFDRTVRHSIEDPECSGPVSFDTNAETTWSITGVKPFLSFSESIDKTARSLTSLLYAEAKRAILGFSVPKDCLVVHFADSKGDPITPAGTFIPISGTKLKLCHAAADKQRNILPSTMVLSADRLWLAVSDQLGRVLLVDAEKQRVVRMWKGYRDAEMAFYDAIEIAEPEMRLSRRRASLHPRQTRCLFIHAPHRRMLEVWRLTHGPRLATWDVVEPMRLIQAQPHWLGSQRDSPQPSSPSSKAFAIDSHGTLYQLTVSPDLCLAGTDAEAVLGYHEYQLMKECCVCLGQLHADGPSVACAELVRLFGKFRTASWLERSLLRAIQRLSHNPHTVVDVLRDCIGLLDPSSLSQRNDIDSNEIGNFGRFRMVCARMLDLANLYMKFASLINDCLVNDESGGPPVSSLTSFESDTEALADLLNWDIEDADRCLQIYTICGSILGKKLHMALSPPMDIHAFIDCFKYIPSTMESVVEQNMSDRSMVLIPTRGENSARVRMYLHWDESSNRLAKIGGLIFGLYLLGLQTYKQLEVVLDEKVLPPKLLLHALTQYVLRWEYYREVPTFVRRLHRIYAYLLERFLNATTQSQAQLASDKLAAHSSTIQAVSLDSSFQALVETLHGFCLDSMQLSSTYLVALVLRSLLYVLWQALEQNSEHTSALWDCAHLDEKWAAEEIVEKMEALADFSEPTDTSSSDKDRTPTNRSLDENECLNLPVGDRSSKRNADLSPEKTTEAHHISAVVIHELVDKWHDTCTRLEDLLCIGLLVQVPATDRNNSDNAEMFFPKLFPLSLGRVLRCGRACLTELFASWIASWEVHPDDLVAYYQKLCRPSDSAKSSQSLALNLISSATLRECLFPFVYKRLPFTLELDTVVASVAWVYYQKWINEPEVFHSLSSCIEFLLRLSSASTTIAQGLCAMMWQGQLRSWCVRLLKFSCGILTPIRPSRSKWNSVESTELSTGQMKDLSILMMKFLTIYSTACSKAEVVPVFSVEREWSYAPPTNDHVSTAEGTDDALDLDSGDGPSLNHSSLLPSSFLSHIFSSSTDQITSSRTLISEVAVRQADLYPEFPSNWEPMIIAASAFQTFGPPRKPLKYLVDGSVTSGGCYRPVDFFLRGNLQAISADDPCDWVERYTEEDIDSSLDSRRRFLITWLIEQSVQSYQSAVLHPSVALNVTTKISSADPHAHTSITWEECVAGKWQPFSALDVYRIFIKAASTLAKHWNYAKDMVPSQHVLSLYEANLDEQAELFISQVENLASLTTRLLLIVGKRVAWHCFGPTSNTSLQLRWRACVAFELESWLRGLFYDQSQSGPLQPMPTNPCDVKTLSHLIDFILQHIPQNMSQAHMAESLRDAIYSMVGEDDPEL